MTLTKSIKLVIIAVGVGLALLAGGCGSSRPTAAPQTEQPQGAVSAETVFAGMAGSYAPWTTFTAPVRMELTAPMRFTASGTATMVRGASIGISIKVLGFEVGALYADADSVTVLIKVNKMGYTESMERFTAATGMGIADLQSLLLGQAFTPGAGTITPEVFRCYEVNTPAAEVATEQWIFRPVRSRGTVDMGFTAMVNGGNPVLVAIGADIPGQRTIECRYSGHEPAEGGTVAADVSVSAALNPLNINASMCWNLGRARWNDGAAPRRLTIPSGYRRVSTETLVNYLRNNHR